jgi:hypothetical protein
MHNVFLAASVAAPADTILEVGATCDQSYEHSNYLEAWYPHRHRITAASIDDATFLEQPHPALRYVRADGRDSAINLHFEENAKYTARFMSAADARSNLPPRRRPEATAFLTDCADYLHGLTGSDSRSATDLPGKSV